MYRGRADPIGCLFLEQHRKRWPYWSPVPWATQEEPTLLVVRSLSNTGRADPIGRPFLEQQRKSWPYWSLIPCAHNFLRSGLTLELSRVNTIWSGVVCDLQRRISVKNMCWKTINPRSQWYISSQVYYIVVEIEFDMFVIWKYLVNTKQL